MIKKKIIVLPLLLTAVFMACGDSEKKTVSGTEAYKMSNLPSKFTGDIPNSITPSSSSASLLSKIRSGISFSTDGSASQGCSVMKSLIGMMQSTSKMAPLYAVIADSAISQNKLTADETKHQCTITLTRAMYDTISSIMGDDMGDTTEMESAIGTAMSIDITYSDTETSPYKYSVLITMDGEDTTIYWSDDKTKTKLSMPIESGTSNGSSSSSSTGKLEFTFDSTENSTHLVLSTPDGNSMDMSLKTKGSGSLFYLRDEFSGSIYLMEGYADDNGGYIKITTTSSSFGTTSSSETFDASGKLTDTNSTYTSTYNSGASDIADLRQDTGYTTTTTVADGMYLITTSSSAPDGTSATVVGLGTSTSGTLVIQDIGGSKVSVLSDTGKTTVYLYLVTVGTSGSLSTASTAAGTLSL
jgi:hypothetical protein